MGLKQNISEFKGSEWMDQDPIWIKINATKIITAFKKLQIQFFFKTL